jgi:hypothetical protein
MIAARTHRFNGLEPDNLLGFLALLGVLRAIECSRPGWMPRASWSVHEPPTRPVLHLRDPVIRDEIAAAAAEGIGRLAEAHVFPEKNLSLAPEQARRFLESASVAGGYLGALGAALLSDKAQRSDRETVEPTPLCLMFGQGHQFFLERLGSVPRRQSPPPEGRGKARRCVAERDSLHNAMFRPWERQDSTDSFRWDPVEDVRYAYRAADPSNRSTKQRTEHGANRLAAVGLASLTVVPRRSGRDTRLEVRGGVRSRRRFALRWPIWRDPVSRLAIEAMLAHPRLGDSAFDASLGVVEIRQATRISVGKFMNFTRAAPFPPASESM